MKHASAFITVWILVIGAVVPLALPGVANGGEAAVGTYGAPFLRIPVGARLIASPDAVVGLDPDASLAFSNPALTVDLSDTEVFLSTANWLDDLRFSALAGAFPTRMGTFSVGASMLYAGGLSGYDNALNVVSENSYYDLAGRLGWGYRLPDLGLSIGLGATVIRQHLYPQPGTGVAFSAGAAYRLGPNLVHAMVRDAGGEIRFDGRTYPVDGQTVVGISRELSTTAGDIIAGGEFVATRSHGNRVKLGADFRFMQYLTLRSGFETTSGVEQDGLPLNAGFGLRYGNMTLDYAYASQEYFSASHTFAVTFHFAGGEQMASAGQGHAGDATPIIADSQIEAKRPAVRVAPPKSSQTISIPAKKTPAAQTPAADTMWLIISGVYNDRHAAEAEARELTEWGIESEVSTKGRLFRVVVARFPGLDDAVRALARFRAGGHQFRVVEE